MALIMAAMSLGLKQKHPHEIANSGFSKSSGLHL
jgi:hypothetical protein